MRWVDANKQLPIYPESMEQKWVEAIEKNIEPGYLFADRSLRANYRKCSHGSKSHGWEIGA